MGEQRSGLNLLTLKDHNMALVLAALRAAGEKGMSQAGLAISTKLTPQAMSKIIGRLIGLGLVVSAGRAASTGGKPATLLRLQPSARQAIGIHLDLGRTTFVFEDLSGTEIARRTVPIGMVDSVDSVFRMINSQLQDFVGDQRRGHGTALGAADLLGVGIACPGPLDQESGVLPPVSHPPQWYNFSLRDELTKSLDAEVIVMTDVDAAARAVLDLNAIGQNHVYIHFGDGLGAGLILNGEVFQSQRPYAGEFGHQVLDIDGPRCSCGRRGCVEASCLQALARGDVEESARLLAIAVANLDLLVGVDRVTLGGPVIEANTDAFRNQVESALAINSVGIEGRVQNSRADDGLVAHGAAAHILDKVFD